MRKSLLPLPAACILSLAVFSCATRKPPALPVQYTERSATLYFTPGIKVVGLNRLPAGFLPIPGRPPLWPRDGSVAVIGRINGRTVVLGFGGLAWRRTHIVAADYGPGPANGRIVNLALSSDGKRLATLVASGGGTGAAHLELVLTDIGSGGPPRPLAAFQGPAQWSSLKWFNAGELALAMPPRSPASAGISIVRLDASPPIKPLAVSCLLTPLQWSEDGRYAVSTGAPGVAPILLDARKPACVPLKIPAPVRVLGWARGDRAFLFAAPAAAGHSRGVFRFDIASGEIATIAISSSAAAYTKDDAILALGSQSLTWRGVVQFPNRPTRAELAIFRRRSQINVLSLGFETLPAMLAGSAMTYSAASDIAAIETYVPGRPVATRKLITYSPKTGRAFLVAYGPDDGPALMSWSPAGNLLAILDSDGQRSMLTIVAPFR